MVTGDLDFKHFFVVKDGQILYDNKEMLSFFLQRLEGKRGYFLVREYEEEVSPNQYAYYFGGIIRSECMNSNCFAGLTDKEIHQVLLEEIRGKEITVTRPNGTSYQKTVTDDFRAYGMRKMALYVNDVITHLQVNYDIHPKDSKMYAGYNKMVLRMKEMGRIEPSADITKPKHQEGW